VQLALHSLEFLHHDLVMRTSATEKNTTRNHRRTLYSAGVVGSEGLIVVEAK
jgi:hypothetical protein